eukprot:gnl/Dysnectes_brevis/7606_a12904_196.p1 GENE.gnl/Dysnectes_brevis/7606_a12904_196~~gnl/Dysnectes_brevis/7606_a12904_196.p1  ORF type:complete len:1003 (-),score=207.44 gnl/Dysnectes_brevis/7606_a12904_196:41-3049(-)
MSEEENPFSIAFVSIPKTHESLSSNSPPKEPPKTPPETPPSSSGVNLSPPASSQFRLTPETSGIIKTESSESQHSIRAQTPPDYRRQLLRTSTVQSLRTRSQGWDEEHLQIPEPKRSVPQFYYNGRIKHEQIDTGAPIDIAPSDSSPSPPCSTDPYITIPQVEAQPVQEESEEVQMSISTDTGVSDVGEDKTDIGPSKTIPSSVSLPTICVDCSDRLLPPARRCPRCTEVRAWDRTYTQLPQRWFPSLYGDQWRERQRTLDEKMKLVRKHFGQTREAELQLVFNPSDRPAPHSTPGEDTRRGILLDSNWFRAETTLAATQLRSIKKFKDRVSTLRRVSVFLDQVMKVLVQCTPREKWSIEVNGMGWDWEDPTGLLPVNLVLESLSGRLQIKKQNGIIWNAADMDSDMASPASFTPHALRISSCAVPRHLTAVPPHGWSCPAPLGRGVGALRFLRRLDLDSIELDVGVDPNELGLGATLSSLPHLQHLGLTNLPWSVDTPLLEELGAWAGESTALISLSFRGTPLSTLVSGAHWNREHHPSMPAGQYIMRCGSAEISLCLLLGRCPNLRALELPQRMSPHGLAAVLALPWTRLWHLRLPRLRPLVQEGPGLYKKDDSSTSEFQAPILPTQSHSAQKRLMLRIRSYLGSGGTFASDEPSEPSISSESTEESSGDDSGSCADFLDSIYTEMDVATSVQTAKTKHVPKMIKPKPSAPRRRSTPHHLRWIPDNAPFLKEFQRPPRGSKWSPRHPVQCLPFNPWTHDVYYRSRRGDGSTPQGPYEFTLTRRHCTSPPTWESGFKDTMAQLLQMVRAPDTGACRTEGEAQQQGVWEGWGVRLPLPASDRRQQYVHRLISKALGDWKQQSHRDVGFPSTPLPTLRSLAFARTPCDSGGVGGDSMLHMLAVLTRMNLLAGLQRLDLRELDFNRTDIAIMKNIMAYLSHPHRIRRPNGDAPGVTDVLEVDVNGSRILTSHLKLFKRETSRDDIYRIEKTIHFLPKHPEDWYQ